MLNQMEPEMDSEMEATMNAGDFIRLYIPIVEDLLEKFIGH